MHKLIDISIKRKFLIVLFIIIVLLGFLLQVRFLVNYHHKSVAGVQIQSIYDELKAFIHPNYLGAKLVARDSFLTNWLEHGGDREDLNIFLEEQADIIGCSAIDVVSSETLTAYQSAGTTQKMSSSNEADNWYFDLINSGASYSNEIYYDLNEGVLYIYLNEIVYSKTSEILGVVGILVKYNEIAEVLGKYRSFGVTGYLIDDEFEIYIHPDKNKIGNVDIYDYFGYLKKSQKREPVFFADDGEPNIYKVDGLKGYLVIELERFYQIRQIVKAYIFFPIYLIFTAFLHIFIKKKMIV